MFGQTMSRVAISRASGPRSPMFSGSVSDLFGLAASAYPVRHQLGQRTPQAWYDEAREEVAEFDALVERVRRLAYQPMRDQIIMDYGLSRPEERDLARGRRDTVAYEVTVSDGSTGPNRFLNFADSRTVNRIEKLKDLNADFAAAVAAAEAYGVLPQPIVIERVIEREVRVPGAAPAAPPSVIPWVIAGAAGLAALAAFGVFGGNKRKGS